MSDMLVDIIAALLVDMPEVVVAGSLREGSYQASRPIAGVATSITAFVGYTSRGIDNRAELILSSSDYERLFGGIAANSELSYAVQQFFAKPT